VVQIAVPGLNIRKVLVRWSQYIPSYWPKLKQHVEKWKGIEETSKAKRYQDNKVIKQKLVLRGQRKRWPSQTWLTREHEGIKHDRGELLSWPPSKVILHTFIFPKLFSCFYALSRLYLFHIDVRSEKKVGKKIIIMFVMHDQFKTIIVNF
jgi:hypothetical protein